MNALKNSEKVKGKFDSYQVLYLALLILVGSIIYANTLHAPFVFDDKPAITENPSIRMEEITPKSIIDAATGYGKSRPVSMLSFGFNYFFGKYNVFGYHLLNIFIHITNGILLFYFLKLTLTLYNRQSRSKSKLDQIATSSLSFFTALLWLANPVQTQSVTLIVQRMNSMGAMFYILALLLYAKGRVAQQLMLQKGDATSKPYLWWFAGCLLAGTLALGCKESTAMLPIFIFLYEWYFFQELDKNWLKRRLKYIVAIVLLFCLVAGIYLGFDPMGKFNTLRDYSFKEFSMGERLLTQARVVIYYLSLIFYPSPSRLNLDHDFPLSYSLFNPITTFLSLILIVALIVLGLYLAKRQGLISFCIFWFLGNLLIESSVIPLAIIFEHRLYLPSMLVGLIPCLVIYRYLKPQWVIVGICSILVAIVSYWTHERNEVWRDEETLWADCVKKSPNKARPYTNLGKALVNQRRYDEALSNLLKAIEIDPNYPEAHINLGFLYEKQGETEKAVEQLRKAIQINPYFAKAYSNLGVALLKQNKTDEALKNFQQALQVDPNLTAAYINIAAALTEQNKLEEAIKNYTQALQINPNIAQAEFLMGAALVKLGRTQQGISHLKKALQIDPDYAEAHNNLGGQLLQEGKIDAALKHLTRALAINPDLAQAHNNVGIIMIQKGNIDAAISHFQAALRIAPEFEMANKNLQKALAIRHNKMDSEADNLLTALKSTPDDPVLNYRLGNLYLGRGELDKAVAQFEKALALKPKFAEARNNLALAYAAGRQYDRALATFKKLIELEPDNPSTYYNIAVVSALQNKVDEAMQWLKKAVDKGYSNWELIKSDRDLANIRHLDEYRQLVKGH